MGTQTMDNKDKSKHEATREASNNGRSKDKQKHVTTRTDVWPMFVPGSGKTNREKQTCTALWRLLRQTLYQILHNILYGLLSPVVPTFSSLLASLLVNLKLSSLRDYSQH